MKLLDYLKDRNETVAEFALRIGEADNTIRKIVYGQRQPSLPLAVKISEATEGATQPGELIKRDSPPPAEAPAQDAA